MEKEKLYVIKSSENKYWKKSFPYWENRVIHCTPVTYSDGQDKIEELENEVDFRVWLEPLEKERNVTEN
jgi:hypothetical protein